MAEALLRGSQVNSAFRIRTERRKIVMSASPPESGHSRRQSAACARQCLSALPPNSGHVRCKEGCPLCAKSGHGHLPPFKALLGTYRTLHFREYLSARVFVTSAIGGARTQHGLPDSRNRFSRHLAKFCLGSTD